MIDWRLKARSTVGSGDWTPKIATMAAWENERNVDPGVANVLSLADGGPAHYHIAGETLVGTYEGGSSGGGALADLGEYEDKTQRRYFRRGREGVYLRVYEVPLNATSTLPKAGAFFPGDTTGPRITSDGVTIGPVVTKGSHTATRITIMAAAPKYAADVDETFTHGI